MSQNEYEQICLEAEGICVILEFPPERENCRPDQSGSGQKDIRQIKKEIKAIFVSELQEKIKQSYGL